ncbi:hypothetical protein Tco_0739946 [Tanacetum coccineum]
MSSSTVTYTSISSDYEEPSNAGSPGVIAPEQAPPSPDYVPGPEHPPSLDYVSGPEEPEQASLSPNYVPKPEYLEYLVPSDAKAPMEDQPLPDDVSPTALSPGYVDDSDSEEDSEEDHADYPADGGDDDDDEGMPFKTDGSTTTPPPPPVYRTTSRMSIPSLSVPPPSPPTTSPTYAEAPLGYKAIGIWLRVVSPPTHHLSEIPLPPLLIPSTTYRDDLPEADMPLQKRARLTAPTGRFKIGESSSAATARQAGHTLAHIVDYGFIDTMNASIRASEIRAMTSVGVVNDRVTDLATTQRQDAQELYMHYEDAQDD